MIAALLVALFAGSAATGFAFDPSPLSLGSCSGAEAAELRRSLKDAYRMAGACLVERGLNPALGRKVRDLLDSQDVRFSCDDDPGDGTMAETNHKKGKASVVMISWPPRELEARGRSEYSETAFHELLHAVDPEDALIHSIDLHNTPIPADPVYGCEIACRGVVLDDDYIDGFNAYEAVAGPLPQKEWPCSDLPERCPAVRKSAGLCAQGLPYPLTENQERTIRAALCLSRRFGKALGDAAPSTPTSRRQLIEELTPLARAAILNRRKTLTKPQADLLKKLEAAGALKPCLK